MGKEKKKTFKFYTPRAKDREDNGTPLQYSCLENPMGRGAWWAAVYGVAQSRTRLKRLSSSSSSSSRAKERQFDPNFSLKIAEEFRGR